MNDRAAKLLRMLEANPGDAFCLYGLGQEYAKAGEHGKAIEYTMARSRRMGRRCIRCIRRRGRSRR